MRFMRFMSTENLTLKVDSVFAFCCSRILMIAAWVGGMGHDSTCMILKQSSRHRFGLTLRLANVSSYVHVRGFVRWSFIL